MLFLLFSSRLGNDVAVTQHILFVVNSFPPRLGGLEKHVESLAQKIATQGHQVSVISIGDSKAEENRATVKVSTLPGFLNIGSVFSFPPWGTKKRIKEIIKANQVTAVSVHTRFFPMSWLGISAARQTGTPVIITEHGSNFVSGVSPIIQLCSRFVDLSFGRWTLRRANKVLAISDESAKFVKRLSGRQAAIFNNAIDSEFWAKLVPKNEKNLVFVGRIVKDKGWKEAIEVFNLLATANPEVQLHLFGEGPEISRLVDLAESSSFTNRIQIHGSQTREIIRKYLSGGVFLNATSLSEGFQTTLIEAACCGARIVSYQVPGLHDLQKSGALIFKAQNYDELRQMTERALKSQPKKLRPAELKNWGWDSRARQYLDIVYQVQRD